MKKCPFCAEEIQDEAIKCRFCGEFLDGSRRAKPHKWYFSISAVAVGLATLGPLALPLVWFHPKYKVITKVIITIGVLMLTYLFCYLTGKMYQNLMQQIRGLGLDELQ